MPGISIPLVMKPRKEHKSCIERDGPMSLKQENSTTTLELMHGTTTSMARQTHLAREWETQERGGESSVLRFGVWGCYCRCFGTFGDWLAGSYQEK